MVRVICSVFVLFFSVSKVYAVDFDAIFSGSDNSDGVLFEKNFTQEEIDDLFRQLDAQQFEPSILGYIGKSMFSDGGVGGGRTTCFSIKNDNLRSHCVAVFDRDRAACFEISDSYKSLRHKCIAIVDRDRASCFSIKNSDLKNECIAIVDNNKTSCYSVDSRDRRNQCLAIVGGDKTVCFSIGGEDMINNCLSNF